MADNLPKIIGQAKEVAIFFQPELKAPCQQQSLSLIYELVHY